jgi:hypothetical protein
MGIEIRQFFWISRLKFGVKVSEKIRKQMQYHFLSCNALGISSKDLG